MPLINLSGQIPGSSIPAEIARDAETVAAIAAHAGGLHEVRTAVISGSVPTAQLLTTFFALPSGVLVTKVLGLTSICVRGSVGTRLFLPPTDKMPARVGHRYYVYMVENTPESLVAVSSGTRSESELVFGAPVKILIHYLL